MSFKLKTVKDLVLSFWIPIVLILLWWVSASYGWINPYLLPPPENVWKAFIELIKEGELYRHISSSLYRSLGGYFLAVCIAFPWRIFLLNRKVLINKAELFWKVYE